MSIYKFSFIATSRNDNHGGNMKIKNNFFINSWVNQINSLKLSAELILVEWNPPDNEPKLKDEIKLNFTLHPGAKIKIITVPKEIHKLYKYSDKINLYQMIAKNVGIKRAEGEFIICTNTDILFSKKLLDEINNISLEKKNIVYRADRHDIDLDKFDNYNIDQNKFYKIKTLINTKYYSHDLIKNKKYYVNRSLKNYLINFIPTFKLIFLSSEPTDNVMILNLRKIKNFFIKIKSRSFFSYDWKYIILKTLPKKIILEIFSLFIYPFIFIYYFFSNSIFKSNKKVRPLPLYLGVFFTPFLEALSIVLEKKLNTNACGDFTMASRENWERVKGYWELDAYSWHIDSICMWNFLYKKSKFKDLKNFTYHINHSIGSGYTPGSKELFKRLEKNNIKYLSQNDLITSLNVLREKGYYNNDDWGLENTELETAIIPK